MSVAACFVDPAGQARNDMSHEYDDKPPIEVSGELESLKSSHRQRPLFTSLLECVLSGVTDRCEAAETKNVVLDLAKRSTTEVGVMMVDHGLGTEDTQAGQCDRMRRVCLDKSH